MAGKLRNIRLQGLREVFTRARLAREAGVSDRVIRDVEKKNYSPREDTQAKILNAINSFRKRNEPYKAEEVFDP